MTCKLVALSAIFLFTAPLDLAFAQTPAPVNAIPPTSESTQMKVGGDVLRPVLTHSVEPKFPRDMKSRGISGVVLVGMIVDAKGKPSAIHIEKSDNPGFDKSAMDAVAKYRFKAGTLQGQPVPVQITFQFY
jgi:TonB family protein